MTNSHPSTEKRSPRFNYWEEAITSSLDEHGVTATAEQIAAVAADMEGAHECHGMAFHVPENPLAGELDRARVALAVEKALVFCDVCKGTGREKYNAGLWSVNTQCWKCHGNGKHAP